MKKIRGDDQADQEMYFDETAKKSEETVSKFKDNFKAMYDTVKNAIGKSKDEIGKLDDKIKDSADRIKDLRDSLVDNTSDRQKALTDRFVEATKELADMQATSYNFDNIQDYNKQQEKYASLQKELIFLNGQVDKTTLNQALDFDKLSPAEKIIQRAKEARDEIEAKIKVEEDKKKLLEQQRTDELTRMSNFNIAKDKLEQIYTNKFKDQLQDRGDAYE